MIDKQKIKAYINGTLTNSEKYQIEQLMEKDPFLADTIEGYKMHPNSIEQVDTLFEKIAKKHNTPKNINLFYISSIAASIIIILSLIFILNNNSNTKSNTDSIADNTIIINSKKTYKKTNKNNDIYTIDNTKNKPEKNTDKNVSQGANIEISDNETSEQEKNKKQVIKNSERKKISAEQKNKQNANEKKKNVTQIIKAEAEAQSDEAEITDKSLDVAENNINITTTLKNEHSTEDIVGQARTSEYYPATKEKKATSTTKTTTLDQNYYLADLKVHDYRHDETRQISIINFNQYHTPPEYESEEDLKKSEDAVFKNQEEEYIPYINFLEKALRKYKKGRYNNAKKDFDIILNQYPNDINAIFYKGLCCYYLENYNCATKYLTMAKENTKHLFAEESTWYLAKSHIKNGNINSGIALINQIINANSFYAEQAKKYLEELKQNGIKIED